MRIRIEVGSEAWYTIIRACDDARDFQRDLSIEVEKNGRGIEMVMVKVGEGMWSPPSYKSGEDRLIK